MAMMDVDADVRQGCQAGGTATAMQLRYFPHPEARYLAKHCTCIDAIAQRTGGATNARHPRPDNLSACKCAGDRSGLSSTV